MTFKIPKSVIDILRTLEKSGYEAYIVGGAVRDLINHKKVDDWDFTTDAIPKVLQQLFPDSFYDNQFGTVGIPIEKDDKHNIFEVTTYRTESSYKDKRHPDKVSWGKTLSEDLSRRDFTINAMALKLGSVSKTHDNLLEVNLELIDPYSGQNDLANSIIKTVGDPNLRFFEDALRMMRAIRIAAQLSFAIDQNTITAISKNASIITQISSERIRDEFIKILESDHPADGVMLLKNSLLLSYIIPEIERGYGMAQKGHHIYDVFTHGLESLHFCPSKNWLIRFAAFIHDIGKPLTVKGEGANRTFYNHEVVGAYKAKEIARRLHFTSKDTEKLFLLVRWHMFSVSEFLTDAAIRRFIRRIGKENIEDLVNVRIADRLGGGCLTETSWRLKNLLTRIKEVQKHIPSVNDLKIDGHDVMKILNIKPGPKVGKILDNLFEEILDDPKKNTREYLLSRLNKIKQ